MIYGVFVIPFVLLFSSAAFAESCECPTVQCEPCQRPLRLGFEELSCGMVSKISCSKIVCENVDNFFQCLAGEAPVYIPASDPLTKITEPRDPAEKIPQPINFDTLSAKVKVDVIGNEVMMEPKDEPKVNPKDKKNFQRNLASVDSETITVHKFEVQTVSGTVLVNQTKFKKSMGIKTPFELSSQEKSDVVIQGAQNQLRLKMTGKTKLRIRSEEDVLWVDLEQGDAFFQIQKSQMVLAMDLGAWRFGKKVGSFGISRSKGVFTIMNDESSGFLRRNELIAKAQIIEPKKVVQVDLQEGILALRDSQSENKSRPEYQLSSPLISRAEARTPASDTLCAAPEAAFETCAWKCFGAGPKDTKCGLKKNSQCVRFTCSADGLWKLPTMATSTECSSSIIRVGTCQ